MPPPITLDELHVTVRVPSDLPPRAAARLRRTLASRPFRRALARAVLAALGPRAPAAVRVRVSR